jgi:hypothetical protein
MDFIVKNKQENIVGVARNLGYVIIDSNGTEYNLVRKLTGENYPRFHAYVKQQGISASGETSFIFSLHLDQKRPIYKGTHAHNGEYEGPAVEAEGDRIKQILQ